MPSAIQFTSMRRWKASSGAPGKAETASQAATDQRTTQEDAPDQTGQATAGKRASQWWSQTSGANKRCVAAATAGHVIGGIVLRASTTPHTIASK